MPDESPSVPAEDVALRYFELDASRDVEAILSLFLEDAVVLDERREWRLGPASKYEYTTTLESSDSVDDTHYRVSGRIDGNFPGGTAELTWDFSTVGGRISRLEIAPP